MRYIKQDGIRDCGICCLHNIIRYYNGYIDLEKLRTLTNTNENGTSIYNLVEASNKLGFNTKAYHAQLNDLGSQKFPLIAYIKINNFNHFVILDDIDVDKVSIFDPIRGYIKYPIEEFLKEWQNIIITYERKGQIVKEESYYQSFISKLVINNKILIIIESILSLVSAINSVIIAIFIKRLFDNQISFYSLLFFIVFIIIKCFIDFFKQSLSIKLSNKIDYELSSLVYKKLISLPIRYHHNRPIGDISSKIKDLFFIKDIIINLTSSTIIDILIVLIVVIMLMFKSFLFIPLILLLLFFYIGIYLVFRNSNIRLYNDTKNQQINSNSFLIDSLHGIDTIKNINVEDKYYSKILQNSLLLNNSLFKFNCLNILLSNTMQFIDLFGMILILLVGLILHNNNYISVGDLSLIYTLYISLFNSINGILSIDKKLTESKLSFYKINNLLNLNIKDNGNKTIKDINTIDFKNCIICNSKKINLSISSGDKVFITGSSGVGKSSLVKTLLKDYSIKNGCININNIDINDIKESSIRDSVTYVGQDEYIFSDTLRNNLSLYKNINSKDINKAMKTTMLDKVLKNKKISLDFLLEENGHNLCGGERQKILLTRALLNGTNTIILDETTSEIDIESERKILKNIYTEYKKTIIFISHRDSNSDLFNKRLVIE